MRTSSFHSRGMTLVELMVSIALGLLLVAVVIQIYAGSKATYNKTEDLARVQENGRVAFNIIGRVARITGYKSNPAAVYDILFPAATTPGIFGTVGGAGVSDSLTVRFQGSGNGAGTPDNTNIDCLGVAQDSNVMMFNRFYIDNVAGRPALFCDTTDDSTQNGQAIVENIEHLRFEYGADPSGDGNADYYVPANLVANWDLVVALRVALVAATPNQLNQNLDTSIYNVLGNNYDPVDDRRSRRQYAVTITLRNRTP